MPRGLRLAVLLIVLAPRSALAVYTRSEERIPVRDGIHLFTVMFRPTDHPEPMPFILMRTPYGVKGENPERRDYLRTMAKEGYIFVYQDIRGRFDSEGTFVMARAPRNRRDPKATDEASDTYDTIEWLLKNVPGNNGKVGMLGISYDGTLTVNAASDPHPALKCASPQSPAMDMFLGDDFHHNGAFRLSYGFEYGTMMETNKQIASFKFDKPDLYDWYLTAGPLTTINSTYLHGTIPSWNDFTAHPNYDSFWQNQAYARYEGEPKLAILNVTGWWDQEDFYGPQIAYASWEKRDRNHLNSIVIGPWNHGGWSGGRGSNLGAIKFGSTTAQYYRDEIQAPWFAYWLKGNGTGEFPEARTFRTGSNTWQSYSSWPPKEGIEHKSLYLRGNGTLSFDPPAETSEAYDEYVSDPANPVPYRVRPIQPTYGPGSRWFTWLVADQRFLNGRADVRSWQTEPLSEDVTITGEVMARLFASTSGTDSDWIAKLIDVYPENSPDEQEMSGYQLMVSNEVFRGRFRRSFTRPEPVRPNEVNAYSWSLHGIDHTFKRGHRIMVQVQSTWFPLIDRNPQRFVPNIFEAKESDFQAATQRIWRTHGYPSRIDVPVMTR